MTGNEKASQKRGFTIYIQMRKIYSQHVYYSPNNSIYHLSQQTLLIRHKDWHSEIGSL